MGITNHIADVARARGYNIRTLAEAAHDAYATAHGLWHGHTSRIDFNTLESLCRVLQVQPGDLLTFVETKEEIFSPALAAA